MLDTFPQVAQLRQKVLDSWVGAFETDDMSSGGCPPMPSKNAADPSSTPAPVRERPIGHQNCTVFPCIFTAFQCLKCHQNCTVFPCVFTAYQCLKGHQNCTVFPCVFTAFQCLKGHQNCTVGLSLCFHCISVPNTVHRPRQRGVELLSLFVRDSDAASDMTNRNSADSKAMVLDALYTTARAAVCTTSDAGASACGLPESVFSGSFSGQVVTAVKIEANTFFGQFGACKKDQADNAWHCEAQWACWCDRDDGDDNDNSNPCRENNDDGSDVCLCNIWGGCGGGNWDGCPDGGCPAIADNVSSLLHLSLRIHGDDCLISLPLVR